MKLLLGLALLLLPAGARAQNGTVPLSFKVTLSGLEYTWAGNLTVGPTGQVTGSGTLTPTQPVVLTELAWLAAVPATVLSGQTASVTIAFTRPPIAPVTVALKTSDPAASVPASVVLPAGGMVLAVPVFTTPIADARMVSIIATLNGQSKGANLSLTPTVVPPPPPPPPPPTDKPLSLSAPALDFGTVRINSQEVVREVRITNLTLAPLVLINERVLGSIDGSIIGIVEGFSVGPFPASIPVGQSAVVQVVFRPTLPGRREVELQFAAAGWTGNFAVKLLAQTAP